MDIKSIALVCIASLAPGCLLAQDAPEPVASPSVSATSTAAAPLAPPMITGKNSTVVHADKLIPLLPPAPEGWSSEKPEGSTTESDGFQITTVGCTYAKGDADNAPTATINIIDSANNQQFQDSTKAMWSATSDTPEGYDKAVTINGMPGFEHFANSDQTGVLWVIAGGRFFVQVETTHQTPAELEAWLTRIDLKKLSALK